MKYHILVRTALALSASLLLASSVSAEGIGRRFPSEKKIIPDPVTGLPLEFLTSTPNGDSKIYQTHPDWTSDGKWLIFRSRRANGEAMAVNEETGDMVQVTDKGYTGMLCVARLSMKLYVMRDPTPGAGRGRGAGGPPEVLAPTTKAGADSSPAAVVDAAIASSEATKAGRGGRGGPGGFQRPSNPLQIVEVDLAKLFADSAAGTLKSADVYERVCGTIPAEMRAGGDMALDANEDYAYFRMAAPDLASKLPEGTKISEPFGPRGMGAGPAGLAGMNLKTGEIKFIVAVPFQIGHVQTNPWVPGEIVFCWETGGKAPQRTWVVNADGTGLRPLYAEQSFEWITHEAVITKDEVAIAMISMNRRPPAAAGASTGEPRVSPWGPAGSPDHPSGVGIVNLRTRAIRIVGQVPEGDPGSSIWHVNGSADGRWAAADDFQFRLWLIDRHSGEMVLLSDNGHVTTAADHQHPTFNAAGTKIEIQSAMLSADKRTLNICVVPLPPSWLARTYTDKTLK
jgi:oligogalacturonide lyase